MLLPGQAGRKVFSDLCLSPAPVSSLVFDIGRDSCDDRAGLANEMTELSGGRQPEPTTQYRG